MSGFWSSLVRCSSSSSCSAFFCAADGVAHLNGGAWTTKGKILTIQIGETIRTTGRGSKVEERGCGSWGGREVICSGLRITYRQGRKFRFYLAYRFSDKETIYDLEHVTEFSKHRDLFVLIFCQCKKYGGGVALAKLLRQRKDNLFYTFF